MIGFARVAAISRERGESERKMAASAASDVVVLRKCRKSLRCGSE